MDMSGVFNKLRNTLSSTVSEISAALPGNPLFREYDAGNQVGSAGPRFLWKIYKGTKKSTKFDVAIWVLEKKQLDQFNKTDREIILEVLRKGCIQMTKLRHPRVLIVEHGLEESRESMAFCTEPVFASLANVLGTRNNITNPSKELQSYELHEIEIKYGLMQLSEGLAFLHSSVKMIHGNICPESVVINQAGAWKLAGFDFCISNSGSPSDVQFQCKDWDTTLPSPSLPNPNYLAPEYILRKSCDTPSDLFSLGVLLYSVYYKGKTLFHSGTEDIYKNMPRNSDKLESLTAGMLENVPSEVRDHEKMLLNPDPSVRPDADQMAKLPFFSHVGVMTLQYLDTLLQRDNLQKSSFFKGLPKVLSKLPKRVVMQRVLPCLTSEFTNHDMIPFVLPSIMMIAEDCTKEEFVKMVFPPLIPVFKVQKPIQVLLILLQKMELILSKTPPDKVQSYVLPMLSASLGSSSLQIQELSMSIIPTFADQLDLASMKIGILPKVRHIALEGDTIAIRIHALVCVGKLVTSFDKWFVQDEILPFMTKITSREPGILMGILGVYQTILRNDKLGISKQVIATKSLPFLIPLSIENTLNLKQYNAFMYVIKEMLQRVESEHKSKLEQLNKMQLEQNASLDFQKEDADPLQQNATIAKSMDDIFNQPNKPATESAPRQHLTLEEKQRLVKMKEQENRMKKEGSLKPVNLAKPIPKPNQSSNKPKDLTSSLMQSNLRSMASTPMKQTGYNSGSMTSSQSSGFGMVNNPNLQMGNMHRPSMQWGSSAPPPGMNMSGPNPFLSNNGNNMIRPNNSMTSQMNSMTLQPQGKNTSSFDNLLSMPSHQKSKPMNQMTNTSMMSNNMPMMSQNNGMMPQRTPMMPQNPSSTPQFPSTNNGTTKQLSSTDLLDFLG